MRTIVAAVALFCLFQPIAHAEDSFHSQEQESSRLWDEMDAYHEGVSNGRTELRRQQEQHFYDPPGCR